MIACRHASHSSRAGSHDATCLSACANLPASLLTCMPALRRSGLSVQRMSYNVMIYHRPCIFIKLEAKGELRGAPTSYLLAAVEITAAAGGEAKLGDFRAVRALLEPRF